MAVGLIILAAALLRLLYLAVPGIDADMAMWGVLAMDILEGRPHFFFAGELFGGALEAWLAAPLFWLFGPSRLLLCLVPFTFSLALVWQVWRLARREMDGFAALVALAWAALAAVVTGSQASGAYIEVPFFTVVCFGLTLYLSRPPDEEGPSRQGWAALGLGLLWTHLLMLPVIAACGLYLLLTRPRALFPRLGVFLAAGFVLGGLPLWLISLPAGLLRPEVLGAGRPMRPLLAWTNLWAEGLPRLLGLPWGDHLKSSWFELRLGLWTFYGAALVAALWPARRSYARGEGARPVLIVLATLYLATYLTAWVFSGTYNQETWRHLMPLYAGLPFVFGAIVGALRRCGPILAWAALLLALGLNLCGGAQQRPLAFISGPPGL